MPGAHLNFIQRQTLASDWNAIVNAGCRITLRQFAAKHSLRCETWRREYLRGGDRRRRARRPASRRTAEATGHDRELVQPVREAFADLSIYPLRESSKDASMVSAFATASRDTRPITAFVHAKTYEFLSVGPHPKEVRGLTICNGTPMLAKGKCKVES